MKKQTAVEFLIDKFATQGTLYSTDLRQSLAMEKEQIRSAYIDGQDDIIEQCKFKPEYHLNSLHYYQKKYESS